MWFFKSRRPDIAVSNENSTTSEKEWIVPYAPPDSRVEDGISGHVVVVFWSHHSRDFEYDEFLDSLQCEKIILIVHHCDRTPHFPSISDFTRFRQRPNMNIFTTHGHGTQYLEQHQSHVLRYLLEHPNLIGGVIDPAELIPSTSQRPILMASHFQSLPNDVIILDPTLIVCPSDDTAKRILYQNPDAKVVDDFTIVRDCRYRPDKELIRNDYQFVALGVGNIHEVRSQDLTQIFLPQCREYVLHHRHCQNLTNHPSWKCPWHRSWS